MINSVHPNTDSLLRFLEKQEDVDNADISLHLARCSKCRTELADLATIAQRLQDYRPDAHSENITSTSQLEKLQRLLAGDISPQQRDEFKKEMNDDKALLRASLHYASHSEAMRTSIETIDRREDQRHFSGEAGIPQSSNAASTPVSFMNDMIQRCKTFLDWQPPMWSIAGVTAVLIVSVAINLQNFTETPVESSIIAYQDSPEITFISQNDNNPGIGFFSNIVSTSKSFTDVRVTEPSQNSISITWPKVENALRYNIRLFQVNPNDKLLIEEKELTTNTVIFSTIALHALQANARFEWSLTGVTGDNKSFQAQGGFVKRRTGSSKH